MPTTWNGTQKEFQELDEIVRRNCACFTSNMGPMGSVVNVCSLHHEVNNNQQFLDRLLCWRRNRHILIAEELRERSKQD